MGNDGRDRENVYDVVNEDIEGSEDSGKKDCSDKEPIDGDVTMDGGGKAPEGKTPKGKTRRFSVFGKR